MALTPGTRLGVYEITARIGEGGMGVVYKAYDTRLNRPAAIKFLSNELADATARQRFQMEAQTASSLNHPHVATVYDVGEYEGRRFVSHRTATWCSCKANSGTRISGWRI